MNLGVSLPINGYPWSLMIEFDTYLKDVIEHAFIVHVDTRGIEHYDSKA
jgi:hypothetical protein